MPAILQYDAQKRILVVTVQGKVTVAELAEVGEKISASTAYPPNVDTLWDLRKADIGIFDKQMQQRLILLREQLHNRGRARLAMVVKNDLGFGLLRMYATHSEHLPQPVKVFKNYAEAQAWLQAGQSSTVKGD